MDEKLISIIIPTYNREKYIKETITSVLNQTYHNFELIIIDDGSTDNTKGVVNSFDDKRIKYIWQENSGTPALARNKGLKEARGEYIAFLDSDDLWLPQKLEKQMKEFKSNKDILLISTNGFKIPRLSKYLLLKENKLISFQELLKENLIINSSVLMNSELLDSVGFLDEKKYIKSLEDYDYWLRVLNYKDNSILILKDLLVKYRFHESSISHINDKEFLRLLKKYIGLKYIFYKHLNNKNTNVKKILKKKIRPIKILILKNQFLQKKKKFFLCDQDINFIMKWTILITYFYQKYLKLYTKVDFKRSNIIVKILNVIYR